MIAPLLVLAATLAAQPRVDTYPVPSGQIPTEIVRHATALWFVAWNNWPKLEPSLGRITTSGKIRMEPMAVDHAPGLTANAPDGTLWLSDGRQTGLWHVLADGKVQRVAIGRRTIGIAVDADGTIWCTHPGSGEITTYGPDGAVQTSWQIVPRRDRASPMLPPPAPAVAPRPGAPAAPRVTVPKVPAPQPTWIVSGPDGAMWFSETDGKKVGRISPSGKIRLFALPENWRNPGKIIAGSDGALWFIVAGPAVLGRITTRGEVTGIAIGMAATALAADGKGRVWYAQRGGAVGYVDADGSTHEVLAPLAGRTIRSMAEGPDGAMWFTDEKARVIGRIDTGQASKP